MNHRDDVLLLEDPNDLGHATGVTTADGDPLQYDPKYESLFGSDAHGHNKTIAEF